MARGRRGRGRRGRGSRRRQRTSPLVPTSNIRDAGIGNLVKGQNIYRARLVSSGSMARVRSVTIWVACLGQTAAQVQLLLMDGTSHDTPIAISQPVVVGATTRAISLRAPRNTPYMEVGAQTNFWEVRTSIGMPFSFCVNWSVLASEIPVTAFLGPPAASINSPPPDYDCGADSPISHVSSAEDAVKVMFVQ